MILGFDIGGTKSAAVLGTSRGEIRQRKEIPTATSRGFQPSFDAICALGHEVAAQAGEPIEAVSVSIGGPLDVLRGIILSPPNLPGWDRIPLKELLHKEFNLPVYVEHDGNAGALAEWMFGAGKGMKTVVFLTMGTGFGAGLILDGRLFRGTTDVAGEAGHVRIAEVGPDCYGKPGSLEGYASGTGIARLAHQLYPELWPEGVGLRQVADQARGGSQEALKVFETAALYFGRGLAMMIDILNPQCIILGGLGMRLQELLVEPALRVAQSEALSRAWETCRIVPAQLGEAIGDYAAICAALDQGGLLKR